MGELDLSSNGKLIYGELWTALYLANGSWVISDECIAGRSFGDGMAQR